VTALLRLGRERAIVGCGTRFRPEGRDDDPHRTDDREPVTGEHVVFRTTSADTKGELVVIDVFVEPGRERRRRDRALRLRGATRLPFPPAWMQRLGLSMGARREGRATQASTLARPDQDLETRAASSHNP